MNQLSASNRCQLKQPTATLMIMNMMKTRVISERASSGVVWSKNWCQQACFGAMETIMSATLAQCKVKLHVLGSNNTPHDAERYRCTE